MESEENKVKVLEMCENASAEFFEEYHEESKNEFSKNSTELDLSKYLKPTTTIVSHYLYRGSVYNCFVGRGFVAATNHLVINKDDVVLASFPKAGTTWAQEIIYNLMHVDNIDKDLTQSIDLRSPYAEWPECGIKNMLSMPSPRLIKTHTHYEHLYPDNCNKNYKIIYLTRNPKDIAVSKYHFYKMMDAFDYNGNFQEFLNLFLNDQTIFSPFGSQTLSYWNRRNQKNILFLKYEELQKDLASEIRKIAKFLEVKVDEDVVRKIHDRCSFDTMRDEPHSNHSNWNSSIQLNAENLRFMRKGKVGDWKNYFDEENNKRFDEWIDKNFSHSDLTFDYEIEI